MDDDVFYEIEPAQIDEFYDFENNILYDGDEAFVISPESMSFEGYQVPFYRPKSNFASIGTEDIDVLHEKTCVCDVELGSEPNRSVFGFNERSHYKVSFYRPKMRIIKWQQEGVWIPTNKHKVYLGKKLSTIFENKVCDVDRPIYHRFSSTSPQSLLLLSCRMGVKAEDGITICSVCGRDHLR